MPTYISLDNLQQYHTSLTNGIGQGFQDLQDQIDALNSGAGKTADDTAFIMCVHLFPGDQLLVGGYTYGSDSAGIAQYFSEEVQEPVDASNLLEQDLLTLLRTKKPQHLRIVIYHGISTNDLGAPIFLLASHVNNEWLAPSVVNDSDFAFSLEDDEASSFLEGFNTELIYQTIILQAADLMQASTNWQETSYEVVYNIPTFFIVMPPENAGPAEPIPFVIEHPREGVHQLVATTAMMWDLLVNPGNGRLNIRAVTNTVSFDPTTLPIFYLGETISNRDNNQESPFNSEWPDTVPEGPLTPNIRLAAGADANLQYGFAYHDTTNTLEIILLDDDFNRLAAQLYVKNDGSYALYTPHFYYDDRFGSGEGVVFKCDIDTTIYDGLFLYSPREE